MAKYRAKQRLYIGGAIRKKDEVFHYFGPPRPLSHMELVPDSTPASAPLAANPTSPARQRLAPAHPDVMAPLMTREQLFAPNDEQPPEVPPAPPAPEPNLEDPRTIDPLS